MAELGPETYSQDVLDMLVVVADLNANGTPGMKALARTIKNWAAARAADQERIRVLEQLVDAQQRFIIRLRAIADRELYPESAFYEATIAMAKLEQTAAREEEE